MRCRRIAASAARAARGTAGTFSSVGGVAGTFGYMAPEQARGAGATEASDLYAVGLVAFEALTGRPALDVAHRPVFEALELAARPRVDIESVPLPWRSWLTKAVAPDPAARFPSAAEMRNALPFEGAE